MNDSGEFGIGSISLERRQWGPITPVDRHHMPVKLARINDRTRQFDSSVLQNRVKIYIGGDRRDHVGDRDVASHRSRLLGFVVVRDFHRNCVLIRSDGLIVRVDMFQLSQMRRTQTSQASRPRWQSDERFPAIAPVDAEFMHILHAWINKRQAVQCDKLPFADVDAAESNVQSRRQYVANFFQKQPGGRRAGYSRRISDSD